MGGYANRTVTLSFPELTEDGDQTVHVTMRNPKTVPLEDLLRDPNAEDSGPPLRTWYPVIARLLIGWHVSDATAVGDEQPLLAEPTAENVAKLPRVILEKIIDEISEATSAGA